jgi:hypothetical protein
MMFPRSDEVPTIIINCPYCKLTSTTSAPFSIDVPHSADRYTIVECDNCKSISFGGVNGGTPTRIRVLYPISREEEPEEYPDMVKDNYKEAVRSLGVGSYKASVLMTRSALQAAMRDKQAKGNTLFQEIEDLAARHVIPDSLKDWAHELRDGGNLAAHPEPQKIVEQIDAEGLLALAESIFQYLYVVPAQVAARRQRLSQTP